MARADVILQQLCNGNERYATGWALHPNQDEARRRELLGGQQPGAIVLTCADSRVVPNLLFDAGLGELFVIRVAGNVATPGALGSIEFAAQELGSPLCLVLGHTGCGAVTAALGEDAPSGYLREVIDAIRPACTGLQTTAGDRLTAAVWANARRQAAVVGAAQPTLASLVSGGRLRVVAACYDLASGRVEFAPGGGRTRSPS